MKLGKKVHDRYVWRAIALFVLLLFTLAACGTNVATTTGSPAAPTATSAPSPTATTGQTATSTGCPNRTNVTVQPDAANVVLKIADEQKATTVKKGEMLEIDLPFGHNWSNPTNNAASPLAMQNPSGYASPADQACVWRFAATNSGSTTLLFTGRPICSPDQMCPTYIMAVSFPIEVQ